MKVLVLTGSARPNSAGKQIIPVVEDIIKDNGATTDVVEIGLLGLPFYDAPTPPSAPEFSVNNEKVAAWSKMVEAADAVVMMTPEYNGGPSAIQKNAIDWIYKEWNEKPVVMIGYGWHMPSRSQQSLKVALEVVKVRAGSHVQLQFDNDINVDGSVRDKDAVTSKISTAISSIL